MSTARRLALSFLLAGMAASGAHAASVQEVLAQLAAQHNFVLVGAARTAGFAAPESAGDVQTRVASLLQDFDHVIVTGVEGELVRVIVGRDRSPSAAERAPVPQGAAAPVTLTASPIPGAQLASPFGPRQDPILRGLADHHGIDLAAPLGTPVRAPAAGIIVAAGWRGGYGRYVRIRHDVTLETAYGHLDRFADGLATGTRVAEGAIIGYVGATGRVTGPHLHYEVLAHGVAIDPARELARVTTGTDATASLQAKPTSAADNADAPAPLASASALDVELRNALMLAYLEQRLDAIARRLSSAVPDCAFNPCE